MAEIVPLILGESFVPYEGPLKVDVEFYIKRPKKTKLDAPKADIDNFLKACFDVMNKRLWVDDTQIKELYAVKEWGHPNQEGYFILGVDKLEN